MNILFVNYGDFTTNSLNHIGGFANKLCAAGHACVVAITGERETLSAIPTPRFIPATYQEVLDNPALFPNRLPADVIHAWTPRECVRHFVLAYQPRAHARLIIHLEDNEEFLLATWLGQPLETLREVSELELRERAPAALSHPRRYPHFLRAADGVTVIVDSLRQFVPEEVPAALLLPGVDFSAYRPQHADAALRAEIGLRADEKTIVFTGSNTFANEPEMRSLYLAVALLNARGRPTRLVRTGFNSPAFEASLPADVRAFVTDLGFVEKARLPRLLALADVLVQPGQAGPFNDFRLPSKLPEFLSLGRPVVLPDTNIGRQLRDGVDALLLRNGSPEEIALACARVFDDEALARTLGRNALAFARDHFNLAINTKQLLAFYNRIREAAPHPGSTALMTRGDTELSLSFAGLAASSKDRRIAALAADLGPLVAALDNEEIIQAARARQEAELQRVRDELALTHQHASNLERTLKASEEKLALTGQHARNLESVAQNAAANVAAAQQEVAAARERLALTQDHARNLEGILENARQQIALAAQKAVAAEERIVATERKAAAAEEKFTLTQKHANNLEAILAAARAEVATTREQVAGLAQSVQRLEADLARERRRRRQLREYSRVLLERAQAQTAATADAVAREAQRSAELERRIADLERVVRHRELIIQQRDEKIRRMQESFSWRATSPLRSLRRSLLDSKPAALPAGPATAPQIAYHLDQPSHWDAAPAAGALAGWCVTADKQSVPQIRVTIDGAECPGQFDLARPDVVRGDNLAPTAERCGFRVPYRLTVDTAHRAVFEVRAPDGGWHAFCERTLQTSSRPRDVRDYVAWAAEFSTMNPGKAAALRTRLAALQPDRRPLISVLMPVYNSPERWLERAIESVREQLYENWELCIADDTSTAPHVRPLLERFAAADPRICVVFRAENGHISAASNSALELVRGEFFALLDHDDELPPDALAEVALELAAHPDAGFVYTDEDKIDEQGRRFAPYFKPDFLPDLFFGQNCLSHLSVYRTALVREVGGFRAGFEGSQDWDLALRVLDLIPPERVRHVPKILYHWRAISGSTALEVSEKNYTLTAARRALLDHFARRGIEVEVQPVRGNHWQVVYPLPPQPPLVSIVIPTRNTLALTRLCVASIVARTTYEPYEILVVNNQSDDPETLAWFAALRDEENIRVLDYDAPFNFSAINNFAARHARGEMLCFLNNDIEVITGRWLDEMVSHAARPEIGAVGAMLYYPNNTVQHAGVILGLGGVANHAFLNHPHGTEGYMNRGRLAQNYSAVTGACLLVRRAIFEQVGGFNENALAIAFNDIDLCLRIRAAGYRNLWTPFAELYHHESASRGKEDTPEKQARFAREVDYMRTTWGPLLDHDPAYNPNLALDILGWSLAWPPRLEPTPAAR
ncbi:MAG TPA: glycosyltransferase [Opitutaceae bacterium]|nr:glycosyltransferase [Opitutaceae bacterium]